RYRGPCSRSTYIECPQAGRIPSPFLHFSGNDRTDCRIWAGCLQIGAACADSKTRERMNKLKLQKLRAEMKRRDVEAILVTSPFNLRYITEFTGTAGLALVTQDRAVFITDFRYT